MHLYPNNASSAAAAASNAALPHLLNLNLPPVLPTQPPSHYAVPAASQSAAQNVTTATVTVTTTTTWQTVAPPPGQTPPAPHTWTQVGASSANITATATTTTNATQPSSVLSTSCWSGSYATDYEHCAKREDAWLKRASTMAVQDVVNIPNTDLRAGDAWLIYRDPNVRTLPGTPRCISF